MRTRTDAVRRVTRMGVLCAAAATLAAAAPAAHALPAPHPGLEFGFSGSRSWYPEAAFAVPDLFGYKVAYKVAAGYAAGGTLEWKLAGPLALETGLRYSLDTERRDVSLNVFSMEFHVVNRTRFHRLGIPLRLRIGLPFVRGLRAEVGAETQYLLRARLDDEQGGRFGNIFASRPAGGRIARPYAQIFEAYTGQEDVTGLYPRWNLALGGGLGWEFPLGRVTGALRGRYQQGISDQTRTPDAKDFTRVGELGLGVRW